MTMSMTWRDIRQDPDLIEHLSAIWRHENATPAWFRMSNNLWTPTYQRYAAWAHDAQELWGLFDQDELKVVVYIEKQERPDIAVIHLSLPQRLSSDEFVRETTKLRDMLFHRGIRRIRGWALRRNAALLRLMAKIGFQSTMLTMDRSAGGRVMRWELMEVRA